MTVASLAGRAYRDGLRRAAARRIAHGLREAAFDGVRPIVVGPFLGEVGFEVLYWLPMVRRLLEEHHIGRERVVALSRGGAGCWYEDFAARSIDFYELVDPEVASESLMERRRRAGDQKQLTIDRLDRKLVRDAGIEGAFVLHPLLMFVTLRGAWAGRAPLDKVTRGATYRPIAVGAPPPGLPDSYVALRVYFSESLPDTPAVRARLEQLVCAMAESDDVVVIAGTANYDGHSSWAPREPGERVRVVDMGLRRENLDRQARIMAAARLLVTTYGGFAQLAPFLGVPSMALYASRAFNDRHYAVTCRAAERLGAPAPELRSVDEPLPSLPVVRR